ncbi:EEF1A lysine methyltransferase 1-like [Dendronephthya gigantea]|uniref:EEF1A lysine methyltransferase 1-like n=1 Tax=Dendronephthya gigantea TaxID=151771 RepID=UPI00106DD0B6|nr:EEF1A lysine methyltransferase 1-like [Dendronephthya gigantea]
MSDIDLVETGSGSDDDKDVPTLPADTLAILEDFYKEQNKKHQNEEQGDIGEDWQLSQFWYDDHTATTLAEEVLKASSNGRICCLCAPTLYKKLCQLRPDSCEIFLFEFDKRFAVFGQDFVYYDYNDPLGIPSRISKNSFDFVFADPPFLTEECFTKVAKTVEYLMKEKLMFCTGLRMQDTVEKMFDAKPCQFIPQHKNNLMNAFRCYTNYDCKLN